MPQANLTWGAYRLLLAFICLVSLIGALRGQPADLVALLVAGSGLVAVHGAIHGIAYGQAWLWRLLWCFDAAALALYGALLSTAEGGPPAWSLVLMLLLIGLPMLQAMWHYAWRSPALWQ